MPRLVVQPDLERIGVPPLFDEPVSRELLDDEFMAVRLLEGLASALGYAEMIEFLASVDTRADERTLLLGRRRSSSAAPARSKKFRDARAHPDVALMIDDLASMDPWTPRALEIRARAETHTNGGRGADASPRLHPGQSDHVPPSFCGTSVPVRLSQSVSSARPWWKAWPETHGGRALQVSAGALNTSSESPSSLPEECCVMTSTARLPEPIGEPFYVEVEPERDAVRVVPVGELDLATAPELGRQLRELRDVGFERLVLDLRRLEFIDSTGLHLILELNDEARHEGYEFSVIPGRPTIQRVFDVTGVGEDLHLRPRSAAPEQEQVSRLPMGARGASARDATQLQPSIAQLADGHAQCASLAKRPLPTHLQPLLGAARRAHHTGRRC